MQKVKSTIPVYDICSLSGHSHNPDELIAAPFGAYLQVHPNLHLPHRHSFYHIVCFTEGGGYHTIDFEKFPVKAGQIYFMIPGQVHSWNFEGRVDGFVVNFSESLFRSFLSNDHYLDKYCFLRGVAHDSVYRLQRTAYTNAISLFEKMISEAQKSDGYSLDYIRACLIELFVTVQRNVADCLPAQAQQQHQLIHYNFRKLVDIHYAEKRLPKEYAALLCITPNHLNALCNNLLGKPAGEIIRNRILLEAKRLLINADQSIADTALQLNFSDNSHFTKFFKKATGITPEEFRKASGNIV
ncbi:MAG: AraC family transcriptional regulator [Taibaiella sp.]|nr:AraC family transcriptional regulator [Taibaiella sp.]